MIRRAGVQSISRKLYFGKRSNSKVRVELNGARCLFLFRPRLQMPQLPQQPQPPHTTEYDTPVLRAASPASSVGTVYGPDQTALSDTEEQLPQLAFERKWEERLGLGMPTPEELIASESPLLSLPNGPVEERGKCFYSGVGVLMPSSALYDHVMRTLRREVQRLEENEIFEQTLLRGSQAGLEPKPSSSDIDVIIQGMMDHAKDSLKAGSTDITNGPWNYNGKSQYMTDSCNLTNESATTVGKLGGKMKSSNRKA